MYPVIGCRFPSAPPLFSVTPLTEESAPPRPLCQKKITLNYNTHICLYRHTGIYIYSRWGEKISVFEACIMLMCLYMYSVLGTIS